MVVADRRPGGAEGWLPPQERVASFLLQYRIAIVVEPSGEVSSTDAQVSSFSFVQYPEKEGSGDTKEVAKVRYSGSTCTILPDKTEVDRRMQIPGFIGGAIRPFSKLLMETRGNFAHPVFLPIHNAVRKVDTSYNS